MKKKSLSLLIAVAMATTMVPSTMAFADTTAPVEDTQEPTEVTKAPASTYEVDYSTHVQNIGWQKAVKTVGDEADLEDVTMAGTEGKSLRLEAIKISGANLPKGASITYKAHSQNKGWMDAVTTEAGTPVDEAEMAGTKGESLRLEALRLTLNGMPGYAIKYQVHVQNKGWMDPVVTENGTDIDSAIKAGTEGHSLRIEAIRIQIVKTDAEKKAEIDAINTVAKAEAAKDEASIAAAKAAVEKVQDATIKAELTEKVDAITGGEEEKVTGDVTVTSINDITTNYVTVGIEAPEEDLTGKTIVVKDSEGNEVAVKAVDIKKGATTAEFDFESSVDEEALTGIWTIGDLSYDFDEKAKIKAFVDADTQLKLQSALNDLNIQNISEDNYPLYLSAKDDLDVAEEDLTVEDIQKLVDKVNADNLSAEEKADLVKSVYDSVKAENDVKLKTALANAAFVKVNNDWMAVYKNTLYNLFSGDGDFTTTNNNLEPSSVSMDDIQDKIYAVNSSKIKSDSNYNVTSVVDKTKLNSIKKLIEDYAEKDEDDAYVDSLFDSKISEVNVQLAVADVLAATTPTSFGNKIAILSELVEDSATPVSTNYNANLNKEYEVYVQANKSLINTVVGINNAITTVNSTYDAKLVTNVKTAANKDKLYTALSNLGVKNLGTTNKDAYYAENYSSINDKTGAQAIVDRVNLEQLCNATKDNIIAKLEVFGIDNFVSDNSEYYTANDTTTTPAYSTTGIADLLSNPSNTTTVYSKSTTPDYTITTTVNGTTTAAISGYVKDAVNLANKNVTIAKQIKKIANATSVSEVDAALKAIYNVNASDMTEYGNVATADKIYIAQKLFDQKGDSSTLKEASVVLENTGVADLYGMLFTSGSPNNSGIIVDYNAKLDAINGITSTDDISTVEGYLSGINSTFDGLTESEKAAKAEAFRDACTYSDNSTSLKTPFKSIDSVNTVLKSVL